MNDALCLAVFAGKILCLVMFVAFLKPDVIGVMQTSAPPADCGAERPALQECVSNVFATASLADAKSCIAHRNTAHC
ncbi:hypothetical protein GA0061098_1016130 [Bradyrhizobium shewense]|uniref:Uncharacterized protein n=1 Tax=Bradyrhizobium shewense TaxID=1761772 RepID=A0A1C3XIG6_9BRAD|nr:hypothetical protein [Bradyrhizobium shewense]SCB51999.1 hypothetical protein GA0061098_1016130 [Bradyrhizobium shewense]